MKLQQLKVWNLSKTYRDKIFILRCPQNGPEMRFFKFYGEMEAWSLSNFLDEITSSGLNYFKQLFVLFLLWEISCFVFFAETILIGRWVKVVFSYLNLFDLIEWVDY